MRERVVGIETEYAILYHPGRGERRRPSNLEIYRRAEAALLQRVRTLPQTFAPLRAKGGRFLENGGSFHYEATAEAYEHGLLELASPECRDPRSLLAYERAKDELVEELAEQVTRELQLAGYRGQVRLGKNNVDSAGHTFGSHESYWVEDPLPPLRKLVLVPLWLALWGVSLPVVGLVLVGQLALLLGLVLSGLSLLFTGALTQLASPRAASWLFGLLGRFSRRIEENPSELTRRARWLALPLYPLMSLHSLVYNRFHFRSIRRDLTAFLVTRALFAGAGAVAFDGGPLLRLAQRPPFLRSLSRIFPDGDQRPLYETRDLFFLPWTALRSRRRLHLLLGDANVSETAQLLRVGTTCLVLEAIESGAAIDWPRLARPLEALGALNADPQLRVRLELADGSSATALEIQRRYARGVRRALDGSGPADAERKGWRLEVLQEWERTLELLERDPDALADRIDWLAKRALVHAEVPDPADRRALELRGAELLAQSACGSAEDARLRELAYRAWRADLRYAELGPRGGARRLERRGQLRRLTDPEQVRRARTEPPRDTRAWARGEAIKWAHAHASPGHAAWHRVRVGKLGWRLLSDPLDPQGR
jgi:proteasome accessory factor A